MPSRNGKLLFQNQSHLVIDLDETMSCVMDKSKSRKGGFSTKIINLI